MAEARKPSKRQGDDFVGPGGNSGNLEAGKSLLRAHGAFTSLSSHFMFLFHEIYSCIIFTLIVIDFRY